MEGVISVIIPVYNREEYVEECVRSVLRQSYQNIQLILIDDGSSDRSLEICREMQHCDRRIEVLEGPHGGVSAARNLGLESARGEYVFFLDSDDVIHPQLLETLYNAMKQTGAKLGGSGVQNVRQQNWGSVWDLIARDSGPGRTGYQNHEETVSQFFRWTTPINLIGGVMMRWDLIEDTRFRTELHIGEDYQFVYENLIKGADAVFLEQRWYYARIHGSNSSWDYRYSGFWTRFHRRELVWKSEEAFGRQANADRQKREATGIFARFVVRSMENPEECRKIRKKVKMYISELWPALSMSGKAQLLLGIYMPKLLAVLLSAWNKMKKFLKRQ